LNEFYQLCQEERSNIQPKLYQKLVDRSILSVKKQTRTPVLAADCVDLMDSRGQVMNLDLKQHSMDAASSVLADRRHYVLLRVCRESVCSTHQSNCSDLENYFKSESSSQGHMLDSLLPVVVRDITSRGVHTFKKRPKKHTQATLPLKSSYFLRVAVGIWSFSPALGRLLLPFFSQVIQIQLLRTATT
uniref:Uncharacterized protein n=1 Tax=Kryptolebias marmoratus TaxID=37003 RepID=A0A3Q3A3B4_KRYMA